MSEREGFLAAITESPDDDTPRLIFADWLDDHDDPLGEFIRLQIALEPLRIPWQTQWDELERVKWLHGIPPGNDHRDPDWPVARQLDREAELLQEHRTNWLGALADLIDGQPDYFS